MFTFASALGPACYCKASCETARVGVAQLCAGGPVSEERRCAVRALFVPSHRGTGPGRHVGRGGDGAELLRTGNKRSGILVSVR